MKKTSNLLFALVLLTIVCLPLTACGVNKSWLNDAKNDFAAARFVPALNEVMPSAAISTVGTPVVSYSAPRMSSYEKSLPANVQNVKVSDLAGGYCFEENGRHIFNSFDDMRDMIDKIKTVILHPLNDSIIQSKNQWTEERPEFAGVNDYVKHKYIEDAGSRAICTESMFMDNKTPDVTVKERKKAMLYSDGANEIFLSSETTSGSSVIGGEDIYSYYKNDIFTYVRVSNYGGIKTIDYMSFSGSNATRKGEVVLLRPGMDYVIISFEDNGDEMYMYSEWDILNYRNEKSLALVKDNVSMRLYDWDISASFPDEPVQHYFDIDVEAISGIEKIYYLDTSTSMQELYQGEGLELTGGIILSHADMTMPVYLRIQRAWDKNALGQYQRIGKLSACIGVQENGTLPADIYSLLPEGFSVNTEFDYTAKYNGMADFFAGYRISSIDQIKATAINYVNANSLINGVKEFIATKSSGF